VGRGAAKHPHKIFLVLFGGFAAKTNQKWGLGRSPNDVASAVFGSAAPQAAPPKYAIIANQHPISITRRSNMVCSPNDGVDAAAL
jgi:hypothetical protein